MQLTSTEVLSMVNDTGISVAEIADKLAEQYPSFNPRWITARTGDIIRTAYRAGLVVRDGKGELALYAKVKQ